MGRGDKKSRKGKIFRGSYGNTRKHAPKGNDTGTPQPAPARSARGPREKQKV
jgi:ribosomal small subunit protein bTHX